MVGLVREIPIWFLGKARLAKYDLGGGNSNIFWNFHPEPWGRWSHFDEHIFQTGWFNHQQVINLARFNATHFLGFVFGVIFGTVYHGIHHHVSLPSASKSRKFKFSEAFVKRIRRSSFLRNFEGVSLTTVDGRVVYPIIYKVLAPSQVVQDFFHQQYNDVLILLLNFEGFPFCIGNFPF